MDLVSQNLDFVNQNLDLFSQNSDFSLIAVAIRVLMEVKKVPFPRPGGYRRAAVEQVLSSILIGICRICDTSRPFRRDDTLADGTLIEKTHMI